MAKHAWVLENVASYLADGLDSAERESLEQHVASCPQCAEAVQQARSLDDTMRVLFADVQPDPALEDRMIQALRQSARPRWRPLLVYRNLALGTAAVLLLGVLGAIIADIIEQGVLPFPVLSRHQQTILATNSTRSYGERHETPGVTTGALSQSVALQDADALATQTREEAAAEVEERLSHEDQGTAVSSLLGIARATEQSTGDAPQEGWQDVDGEYGVFGSVHEGGAHFLLGDGAVRFFNENIDSNGVISTSQMREYQRLLHRNDGQVLDEDHYYSFVTKQPAAQTAVGSPSAPEGTADAEQIHFKPHALLAGVHEAETVADGQPAEPATAQPGQDAARSTGRQADSAEANEADQDQPAAVSQPKVVRSGAMEFVVDSFDSAVENITKITAEEGGFIATVDSEQLPNGKMRGSVVVRVQPERLDTLVLKFRALGELKSQKIGSEDVTKQYTDVESRLRAARAMEVRLLDMIKNGKGDIEHLLQAEKELGVWRTKIEETEGELRYYNNVIALSTLKVTLAEKEIRAAAALTETERVQMGIEVEDVESAHQEALKAVDEANGLVTKSELKQHAAEQYSAVINFEIDRDAAGPLRDRLRQIGHVARLEIDRVQQAEGGSSLPRDARTVRKDTQFSVSLYNVANVAPRETIHVTLACRDTEAVYKTILERVQQAGGRVVTSSLKSQQGQKTTGSVQFELPVAEADTVLTDVKGAGEVMRLEVTENSDSQNVTKSKRGFNVQFWAMGLVAPRETIVLQVATDDVTAGYHTLQEAVRNTTGRILNAQLNEQDRQNITAQLDFDIPRDDQPTLSTVLETVGEVFSRNLSRSRDEENAIDSKVRLQVALIYQARIPPRETITLGIEVGDVDQATNALTTLVAESKGRTVESHLAHERSGRATAKVVFDVPLASASGLVENFKASGTVRAQQSTRNPQVPDGKLAIARLDVTLSNAELIVPRDGGLWAQIRTGLATSFTAISWSLIVVIVGLCFVLPWALVLYVGHRVIARIRRKGISGVNDGIAT